MAPMKSLSTSCTAALLLSALILIVQFQQAIAQCGNFQLSCINIAIGSNGVLSAQCYTNYGYIVGAATDLNYILGNNDGSLDYGLNFSDTCGDMNVYNEDIKFYIAGYCYQVNGALQLTSYDIGYQITNSDGTLIWTYCH